MKPAEPHVAGPAGQSGISESSQAPYTAPPPVPQQTPKLGGVTRRIVERLDRRRSRTTGASKPRTKRKTKPTPEEQRKAAFNDPRQLWLPINHPNIKDQSHGKA